MWRFHKYFGRELLTNLGLTFVMLFGIVLLSLVARGISQAPGQSILIALYITLLFAIDAIPHLLNISLLIATVFTFSRAAADNEITALRMAGLSPLRLMGSVLFVGALVSGVNSYLVHNLIPTVHFNKFRAVTSAIEQFVMSNRSTTNSWEIAGTSMRWKRQNGRLYEEVSFKRPPQNGLYVEGFAKTAELGRDPSGEELSFTLNNQQVFIYKRGKDGQFLPQMGGDEEQARISLNLRQIMSRTQREEGEKDVNTAQLVAEQVRGDAWRPGLASWLIWDRSSRGLAGLLFAIVAFPIGLLMRRAGKGAAVAFSLVPLTFYYFLLIVVNKALATSLGQSWPAVIPLIGLFLLSQILMHLAFRR